MTPADVAENLLPKSEEEGSETCLKRLIEELKEAKREVEEKVKQSNEEKETAPRKAGNGEEEQ